MSIRTLVEFNHDLLHILERDPDAMRKLVRAMLDAYVGTPNEPPNGVRIITSRHHSDGLEVKVSSTRTTKA